MQTSKRLRSSVVPILVGTTEERARTNDARTHTLAALTARCTFLGCSHFQVHQRPTRRISVPRLFPLRPTAADAALAAKHKMRPSAPRVGRARGTMATPVGGVDSTPLFGGLSGYKRDTPGKPTSVPGGSPAFRGKPNKPGSAVGAPSIRTSYNRQDQGTNVCIPYSRIVPLHHLQHVGRVQSGDVVFHQPYRVNRTYLQPDPRVRNRLDADGPRRDQGAPRGHRLAQPAAGRPARVRRGARRARRRARRATGSWART